MHTQPSTIIVGKMLARISQHFWSDHMNSKSVITTSTWHAMRWIWSVVFVSIKFSFSFYRSSSCAILSVRLFNWICSASGTSLVMVRIKIAHATGMKDLHQKYRNSPEMASIKSISLQRSQSYARIQIYCSPCLLFHSSDSFFGKPFHRPDEPKG